MPDLISEEDDRIAAEIEDRANYDRYVDREAMQASSTPIAPWVFMEFRTKTGRKNGAYPWTDNVLDAHQIRSGAHQKKNITPKMA